MLLFEFMFFLRLPNTIMTIPHPGAKGCESMSEGYVEILF